ncbi:NitT/TauT family transport system permease protein [Tindallia magadiensis]|uniref:NitT/TauT family transport system permease protein n=1 Tax=Tindallia magadiensis TaxID=69895 RepID=A0A1I3ELW5_9FIRM|nr:NitT/TauT family transport system permease protein [Tindallia magadiensis]
MDEFRDEANEPNGKVKQDMFPSIIGRFDKAGVKVNGTKFHWLGSVAFLFVIWQAASMYYQSNLLLPSPMVTMIALGDAITDQAVLLNMAITLRRVLLGFFYATLIGLPLGFLMGYSGTILKIFDPLISSMRQVPIMAWIPLAIVWLGLGDGPTIFLIAMAGIFPLVLNTINGVQNISPDYYNAAKSMGAGKLSIFTSVIVPSSLPDILNGMRLAISAGWMSVI